MATPAIILHSMSYKTANDKLLFDQLSLTLDRKKTGLIGNNGSGKTTLLKLITKQCQPLSGSVEHIGTIGYLQQLPATSPQQCVADGLGIGALWRAYQAIQQGSTSVDDYEAVNEQWDIEQQAQSALTLFNLANICLDRTLSSLSGGQLTRVQLARVFMPHYDYLLLDEPSNNLDSQTRQLLYNAILHDPRGMLIASHDRQLLQITDDIYELSSLGVNHYGGNYTDYCAQKAVEQDAAQQALTTRAHEAEKGLSQIQKRKQTHQRAVSKGLKAKKAEIEAKGSYDKMGFKSAKGRSEKTNKKILTQANRKTEHLQKQLDEAKSQIETLQSLRIDFINTNVASNKSVLQLNDVSFGYDEQAIIKQCNLIIKGPQRLALTGANGSGKTTLIKLITDELQPQSGTISRGVEHIAYLDQQCSLLNSELSVIDNFRQFNPDINDTDAYRYLDHFLFRNKAAQKSTAILSGGERLRALLACVLMSKTPPQLLILDEPTNHLDINSIECIEQAIKAYQGALIVVSHDDTFLNHIGIDALYCLD